MAKRTNFGTTNTVGRTLEMEINNPYADIKAIEMQMVHVYQKRARTEIENAKKNGGFEDKFYWGSRPFLGMHMDTQYQSDKMSA